MTTVKEVSDSKTVRALTVFVGLSCMLLLFVVIYSIAAVNTRLALNHDQAIIAHQSAANELTKDTMFRERQDQQRQRDLMQRLDEIDKDVKKGS